MNKSVRLHHPLFVSCNYVVEMPQKYPRAYECPACLTTHTHKAIHLRLDEHGDVFVHPGIYELLKTVGLAGMEFANEVIDGPGQVIGAVELVKRETINANGHKRFWVPGRTKYESRDVMHRPFIPVLEAIQEKVDRAITAARAEKRSIFIFGRRK